MTRKQFLIAPAALVLFAMASAGAPAAIPSPSDAFAPSATARTQAISLAQAQMQAAPKKKAGGRAERQKPAAITPACPRGQFWNASQKTCLPGSPATPIPIPGMR